MMRRRESEDSIIITEPTSGNSLNVEKLKVVYHIVPGVNGNLDRRKCVEFVVIGKNKKWDFWTFYEDFVKVNPSIKIKE